MARDFFSFYRSFDYLGLRIDNLKVESGIFIEKSHFRSSKKSDGNELHFRRKLGYGGHPTGLPNTSVPVCPSRKGRKKPKRKRKCEKLNFRSRFRRPVRTGLIGSVRKCTITFVSIDTNTNVCAQNLFHNLIVCVFEHKLEEFVRRANAAYQTFRHTQTQTQTQTQTYATIQNLINI